MPAPMTSDPSDLLKVYLQEQITVKLRSGELYEGVLKAFDEHLNVLITMGEEALFIRGENIMFLGQQC